MIFTATSPSLRLGSRQRFFSKDPTKYPALIDALVNNVGRVNINAQCQRGPDTFPFNGRKSSALGTLSVSEALKVVSTESVISTKDSPKGQEDFKALAAAPECKILSLAAQ